MLMYMYCIMTEYTSTSTSSFVSFLLGLLSTFLSFMQCSFAYCSFYFYFRASDNNDSDLLQTGIAYTCLNAVQLKVVYGVNKMQQKPSRVFSTTR